MLSGLLTFFVRDTAVSIAGHCCPPWERMCHHVIHVEAAPSAADLGTPQEPDPDKNVVQSAEAPVLLVILQYCLRWDCWGSCSVGLQLAVVREYVADVCEGGGPAGAVNSGSVQEFVFFRAIFEMFALPKEQKLEGPRLHKHQELACVREIPDINGWPRGHKRHGPRLHQHRGPRWHELLNVMGLDYINIMGLDVMNY